MNTQQLASLFKGVVPDTSIVSDRVALRVYESDGLSAFK